MNTLSVGTLTALQDNLYCLLTALLETYIESCFPIISPFWNNTEHTPIPL